MKHNKIFSLRWLTFAVLITALVSSVTLSRYITTISGTVSGTIAKFQVELDSADSGALSFSGDFVGSDYQEKPYTFSVCSSSDVAVEYDITVSFPNPLPHMISVGIDQQTMQSGNDTDTEFHFNGDTLSAGENREQEHTLILRVNYVDELGEPYDFENLQLGPVTITVYAAQTTD